MRRFPPPSFPRTREPSRLLFPDAALGSRVRGNDERKAKRGSILALLGAAFLSFQATPASAREAVEASAPSALSVTLYRDPDRGPDQPMNRDLPRGFAMITETRQVTLPAG